MEQANIAKFENMTSGQALEKHLWFISDMKFESDIRYATFLRFQWNTEHNI